MLSAMATEHRPRIMQLLLSAVGRRSKNSNTLG
jgi:hypothetical protein